MSEPLLNPRNQNWEVIAQKISTPTGATGTTGYLTLNAANGVKINTIVGPTGSTNPALFYNTTTKEITYSTLPASTFASVTYSCDVLTDNIVKGTGTGTYIQIGNFVQVLSTVSFTSTGTTNGIIALSLPAVVTNGTSNVVFYGNFGFIRAGVAWYFGNAAIIYAGTISGIAYGSQNYMGVSVPQLTMQIGDTVSTSCCFFV